MATPPHTKLGAGTLKLGETAAETDFSTQATNVVLASEVEKDDDLYVLSGDVIPGGLTTTSTLSGTLVLDPYTGGSGAYTWTNHGKEIKFTFTPNTAAGITVTGTLVVTRLDIGSDEYGNVLTADFEWNVVGEPTVTWGTATP